MNWNQFTLGFWHPFGPHGGESREEILAREAAEIAKDGWTLWSFQFRRSLGTWYEILRGAQPETAYVLLSDSRSARDPSSEVRLRGRYCLVGTDKWQPLPSHIRIPHPGRGEFASAFMVKGIILGPALAGVPPLSVQWYFTMTAGWRSDRLPTRGEYLIRRGKGVAPRSICGALELRYPYLATLRD